MRGLLSSGQQRFWNGNTENPGHSNEASEDGGTMDTLFPASSPPWAILGGLSHMKDIPCRSSILVKFWSGELPTLADLKLKFVVEVEELA